MATAEPVAPDADAVLERERAQGPRYGYLALLAAVLVVLGNIGLQLVYADVPRVPLIDALRDAAGENIGRPGLLTEKVLFYNDKALQLILVALVQALGALCVAAGLLYLHSAASARQSTVPRMARLLAMLGGAATAVGSLGLQIAVAILAHNFAGQDDHSTQAAHDALRSGVLVAMQFVGFIGTLSLALAFVLISLGAMRVGLLTRFMGFLGVIVGILLIFPLFGPSAFVVEAFWLAALGVLFLRRWPSGLPPAWVTGGGEPWPSQQAVREARQRQRQSRGGGDQDAPPAERPGRTTDTPSPATSQRKKRKRRV
jgi:hypothetical protein